MVAVQSVNSGVEPLKTVAGSPGRHSECALRDVIDKLLALARGFWSIMRYLITVYVVDDAVVTSETNNRNIFRNK